MKRRPFFWRFKLITCILLLGNIGCKSQLNAQTGGQTPFSMGDGTVVDPARGQIFITDPGQKAVAISLTSGQKIWSSTENAKPLAITGNRLLCQTTSAVAPQYVVVAQLDLDSRGNSISSDSIALPQDVQVDLTQSARSAFDLITKVSGNRTYFSWNYVKHPLRGLREDGDSLISRSGALQYNPITRSLNTITKAQLPANFTESIVPPSGQRIANKQGQQFLSRDKRHILSSRKVGTDDTFENYLWEIYTADTGQKVGQLNSYSSYAPFFVSGNMIIYQQGPYVQNVNDVINEVALQLVAVNLETGTTIWNQEILDTLYRGPSPP